MLNTPSAAGPPEPPDEALEGTPYRIIQRLAQGGMGVVYLAHREPLGNEVVVKLLHEALPDDAHLVDRMRLEAQALGRLRHPNLVDVLDFNRTPRGRPYIVMAYLNGHTLAEELLQRGALPLTSAVGFAAELCSALQAVHAIGIVHRDIEPDNLFLHRDPRGVWSLKLLDFACARILPDCAASIVHPLIVPTDTGFVIGTPHFISPEAARGQRVDHRADVYGAGLVLYAMLAGRGPFDDIQGTAHVLAAHAVQEPPPPSRFSPEPIPRSVEELVLRALRKNPAERFQSARDFDSALREVAQALAAPPSAAQVVEASHPPPARVAVARPAERAGTPAHGSRTPVVLPDRGRRLAGGIPEREWIERMVRNPHAVRRLRALRRTAARVRVVVFLAVVAVTSLLVVLVSDFWVR
jgi:serine/threonine-protein kinase